MKKKVLAVIIVFLIVVAAAEASPWLHDPGPLLVEEVEIYSMPCVMAYYKSYLMVGGLSCDWDQYIPPPDPQEEWE